MFRLGFFCGRSAQAQIQTHPPAHGGSIAHGVLQLGKPHSASDSLGEGESVGKPVFAISYLLGLRSGKSEVDLRVLKGSRTRQGWLFCGSRWTPQANHGFLGARSRNYANFFFSSVSACYRSTVSRVT